MRTLITILAVAGILAAPAMAQRMRAYTQIPSAEKALEDAPEGAELPEKFERVPRSDVNEATSELAEDWTKGDLSNQIDDDFFDGQRLTQNMDIRVPKDAKVRIEGVSSIQTNNQFIMRDDDGGRVRVSTVTATVRTLTTANDPAAGLVRLQGVNRLTFEVKERLD